MSFLPLHDSVYRALTNPDLDRPLSSTISTPLLNESPPFNATATPVSVLSSSSQDNLSAFSIVGDTSEDEEYNTGNNTSFIMPRVVHNSQALTQDSAFAINVLVAGPLAHQLLAKLSVYARTLTHCDFHLEGDNCPNLDLAVVVADSEPQLSKCAQNIRVPFIPVIAQPIDPQDTEKCTHPKHLPSPPATLDSRLGEGPICSPVYLSSTSNPPTMLLLIDFLANLSSPQCISSPQLSPPPLSTLNSVLITSVSAELEAKLASLKEYPQGGLSTLSTLSVLSGLHGPRGSSGASAAPLAPLGIPLWALLTGFVCCCYCIYTYII